MLPLELRQILDFEKNESFLALVTLLRVSMGSLYYIDIISCHILYIQLFGVNVTYNLHACKCSFLNIYDLDLLIRDACEVIFLEIRGNSPPPTPLTFEVLNTKSQCRPTCKKNRDIAISDLLTIY